MEFRADSLLQVIGLLIMFWLYFASACAAAVYLVFSRTTFVVEEGEPGGNNEP